MCGIFGYLGKRNSAQICIEGLKRLEYRGYDSAGIAGVAEGRLISCKEIGKLHVLEDAVTTQALSFDIAIAHTRWATHGKPSKENAHPHFDQNKSVAVVHNGIIENHAVLKAMLKKKGVSFQSDSDSEVIAQLIAHFYEGDLLMAVQKTLALLQGFWGLAIIHKDHPDKIVAAARENSIAIGLHPNRTEAYVASDANAFTSSDLDIVFLRSDEVALVSQEQVKIFDSTASPVSINLKKLGLEQHIISKNGFEHFMLKEIFEQPHTIQQAFHNRCIEEYGTAEFENLELTPQELLAVRRILILACGTSWHAGSIAASLFEDQARIPTQCEIASEFRYKNPIISEDTLVIAISQSGETLDTIAAVREVKSKGAKVLGICNVRNSTLSREADYCIYLRAGPEISVCSTKAFTSQLTVLSLFALLMARLRHMSKEDGQLFLSELQAVPTKIEKILAQKEEIKRLAHKYSAFKDFFFLGRHYMFTTSLEAALKLKEISYLNAMGYPAGEMKHGPIALASPSLAVIGMCGNARTYEKMLSNLMELKARGAPILAFAPEGAQEIDTIATDVLYLPPIIDPLACIPYSVAAQLFAYYIAQHLGTDVDQPRNLAKSVTVE